jgi:hypothetical protein
MSKRYTLEGIAEIFPELGGYVQHPIHGRLAPLADVIVSLNDFSEYTREQIADWLCRLGGCEHPVGEGKAIPLRRCVGLGFGRYHKLAVAMRRGCLLRPKKVKGFWKHGNTMACALGTVAEGAGFREKGIPWNKMWDRFPELKTFISNPLTTVRLELWRVVSTLSDNTNYSREEIADWLCVQGGCKHPVGFVPDLVA